MRLAAPASHPTSGHPVSARRPRASCPPSACERRPRRPPGSGRADRAPSRGHRGGGERRSRTPVFSQCRWSSSSEGSGPSRGFAPNVLAGHSVRLPPERGPQAPGARRAVSESGWSLVRVAAYYEGGNGKKRRAVGESPRAASRDIRAVLFRKEQRRAVHPDTVAVERFLR
jgi:hypothetical protein